MHTFKKVSQSFCMSVVHFPPYILNGNVCTDPAKENGNPLCEANICQKKVFPLRSGLNLL